ncbi:hypothetical protein SCHPADRAFT_903501 [Schizopora paradoxa]|uniref:Uncharacterized protein n=1 Tax=Schizopora paradoxa TaxID=27342 RepID=A0A0H2RXI2_9AGAM|nr:hypothetical protein SCHPADRAFT_903501 [Schizopora paradoxa]
MSWALHQKLDEETWDHIFWSFPPVVTNALNMNLPSPEELKAAVYRRVKEINPNFVDVGFLKLGPGFVQLAPSTSSARDTSSGHSGNLGPEQPNSNEEEHVAASGDSEKEVAGSFAAQQPSEHKSISKGKGIQVDSPLTSLGLRTSTGILLQKAANSSPNSKSMEKGKGRDERDARDDASIVPPRQRRKRLEGAQDQETTSRKKARH